MPIVVGGTGLTIVFLWVTKLIATSDEDLRKELKALSQEELIVRLQALDPQRKEIHDNDRYRLVRALEIALLSQSKLQSKPLLSKGIIFALSLCFC